MVSNNILPGTEGYEDQQVQYPYDPSYWGFTSTAVPPANMYAADVEQSPANVGFVSDEAAAPTVDPALLEISEDEEQWQRVIEEFLGSTSPLSQVPSVNSPITTTAQQLPLDMFGPDATVRSDAAPHKPTNPTLSAAYSAPYVEHGPIQTAHPIPHYLRSTGPSSMSGGVPRPNPSFSEAEGIVFNPMPPYYRYPDPEDAEGDGPYPRPSNISSQSMNADNMQSVVGELIHTMDEPILVEDETAPQPITHKRPQRDVSASKAGSSSRAKETAAARTKRERKQAPAMPIRAPVLPQPVHGKEWLRPNKKTKGKNLRSANIANFDPERFYEPLPEIPQNWGGYNSRLFRYKPNGELLVEIRLTADQMMEYLRDHPRHTRERPYDVYHELMTCDPKYVGHFDGKQSGLTLWIQTVPADAGRRYDERGSDKCRFRDCPAKNNTMLKGQFRVTFDEHSNSNFSLDPYQNAGYVHLYCLEKFCDLPTICKLFNMQPDTRTFAEGRNKMALNRDGDTLPRVFQDWVQSAVPRHIGDEFDFEKSLTKRLTDAHIESQPVRRQRTRETRAGNSIDQHRGNLDVYSAEQKAVDKLRAKKLVDLRTARRFPSQQQPAPAEADEMQAKWLDGDGLFVEEDADEVQLAQQPLAASSRACPPRAAKTQAEARLEQGDW